jgi:protein ImuA
MIAQLRQSLRALQKPARIDGETQPLSLGVPAIDAALGGGLAHGALHEIAAAGEAHVAAAAGFALGLAPSSARLVWITEDMALAESGAPYGPGLDAFGLLPERLLTVAVAQARDLMWAMEEALRCRAVATVIGELRHGELDAVAVRRLSLAAGQNGALALLLRASPPHDASTAATRWVVGAAPSSPSPGGEGEKNPCFAVRLTRNRRGPLGAWTLQWSNDDERFVFATHAQPVAAPAADRPHQKVA